MSYAANSLNSGLGDLTGNSSSSDNDESKEVVSHESKTFASKEQMNKFQSLVHKRVQLQENYKKKLENKRLKKLNISRKETSSTCPDSSVNNLIFLNDTNQFDENLEKEKIDAELASSNIERAIVLSDELSVKKANESAFRAAEAVKFKELQEKKRLRSKANKKPIEWRFEPKKKWETKSNM